MVHESICLMLRLDLLLHGCLTWSLVVAACRGWSFHAGCPHVCRSEACCGVHLVHAAMVMTGCLPTWSSKPKGGPAQLRLLQGPLRQAGTPQVTSADSPSKAGELQVRANFA